MWKKLPIFIFWMGLISLNLFANPYDRCKDILRLGIQDSISSHHKMNRRLAAQQEFCTIAKENSLDESNFETFARDYVNKTKSRNTNHNAGFDLGWKFLNIGANYGDSNIRENASENEKIDFLKSHKKSILDRYRQSCGSESMDDSLRTEAVLNLKIANSEIVKAWRECMVAQANGFMVELIPSSSDMSEDEIEYSAMAYWQSQENTELTSITLTFRPEKIEVSASNIRQQGIYATVDFCEDRKCTLKSNSNLSFTILQKDRSNNVNLTIEAKNDRGMLKNFIVTLPKKAVPVQVDTNEPSAPNNNIESYWSIENYCGHSSCPEYLRDFQSQKHEIGENFVASIEQLDPGFCSKCGQKKGQRFCFKNCKYMTKVQMINSNVLVESPEKISGDMPDYAYPFTKGRDSYSRVRITTERNS